MIDLSTNPEAPRVNPAEARRIAQMQEEIVRLQPTPKKSSTSYATTGDGGVTPMRATDVEERRRIIAQSTPPVSPVSRFWNAAHERFKAQEEKWAKDEQAKQDAIRREIERRKLEAERSAERKKRLAEFEANEATRELALAHLTDAEKARVMQKLLNAGKIHDADLAWLYAQQEVAARGDTPAEKDAPVQLDWRAGLSEEMLNNSRRVLVVERRTR